MSTNTDYKVASIKDPGSTTSSTGSNWTQSQGGVVSMAYKAMMDLQSMLVKLQEYWQEMINTQAKASAASACTAAQATKAAANDAAKMLVAQSITSAVQAGVAGFEGGYGLYLNSKTKPKLSELQTKENKLNELDRHLNNAPNSTTLAGNRNTPHPQANEARKEQLLRGGHNLYDDNRSLQAAEDRDIIGSMTPEERRTLGDKVAEERGNLSRERNNLTSEMQRDMTALQLTASFVNSGAGAIDKGCESNMQADQGLQQAVSSLEQSSQQQAQQAVSEANKNKDALAAEAAKTMDTLAALAQASRAA